MDWWTRWNLPLHVGSIGGMATKAIWFIPTIVMTFLPVTGLWMWWKRRPRGTWGLPLATNSGRVPWWMIIGVGLLRLLLPTFGASLLVIHFIRLVIKFCRRRVVTHAV